MRHTRVWSMAPAAVIIAVSVTAPAFINSTSDQGDIPFSAPSPHAWLGTDHLGHSVLPQLLSGGWKIILVASLIAVLVTSLAAVTGTVAALQPRLGGYLERVSDAAMLVPPILAIMLVLLSWPSAGTIGLIVVAVVVGTPYSARVFAAAAKAVATCGFVEVAVASGEPLPYLVVKEVLPNLRETTLTQLGLRFVEAIYLVSTAAFLALPASLGQSNWALMVRDNSGGLLLNPWAVAAPAFALALVAISLSIAVNALASRRVTR